MTVDDVLGLFVLELLLELVLADMAERLGLAP